MAKQRKGPTRPRLTSVQSAVQESPREALMAEAATIRRERSYLDERLDRAVYFARESGLSWTDVGTAFGMSRQAAFQRWGRRQRSVEQMAVEALVKAVHEG